MNSVKVLFIWDVRKELREYLQKGLQDIDNLELVFLDEAAEEEYLSSAEYVDAIVGWRPTDELLEKAVKLRLFINPGAGVQHLVHRFKKLNETRKITLVNGHGNSYFTAQHAVALLLAIMNKVVPHHNWMTEGKWRMGDNEGRSTPLRSRRVGLLGYGAVNSKVHSFLSGFDVEFHILKRTWESDTELPTEVVRYTPKEMHQFLEEIDTLIIAVPQTPDTEGLIGLEELRLLGPDGFLVNMARGSVIDEEALYNILKNKTIAGASIDVWYEYGPDEDEWGRKYPFHYPFHELQNVVLSPHRGASPMEDLRRWDEVIENLSRLAKSETEFMNTVELDRGY